MIAIPTGRPSHIEEKKSIIVLFIKQNIRQTTTEKAIKICQKIYFYRY
jgi:hypothetical protein